MVGCPLALVLTTGYPLHHQSTFNTQSMNYKWKIEFAEHYQITPDGVMYNIRTGRKIKRTVNGYSVGYWIAGKFYTCARLRAHLMKINHEKKPF